ncbi:hypothetical protein D3C83_39670 [compost metagenome]
MPATTRNVPVLTAACFFAAGATRATADLCTAGLAAFTGLRAAGLAGLRAAFAGRFAALDFRADFFSAFLSAFLSRFDLCRADFFFAAMSKTPGFQVNREK